jgi:parallel beta-helix repeat protein
MQNNIVEKGLVLGIIILFLGIIIMPSIGGTIVEMQCLNDNKIPLMDINSKRGILYVGGSGPGNYTHIQDAIDDASNGDTIFVYDLLSPYTENLRIVGKSITLIGEDKATTSIEGYDGNDTIFINANNVIITGFTISYSYTGIRLLESEDCTIYLNNIKYNVDGIIIDDSCNNNIIYNNNFIDNIENAYDEGNNKWNKPFPIGGNYWYDYEEKYPDAKKIFGFWVTPYVIPGGSRGSDNCATVGYNEMSISESYSKNSKLLNRWFDEFPNIFPILRSLLKLL